MEAYSRGSRPQWAGGKPCQAEREGVGKHSSKYQLAVKEEGNLQPGGSFEVLIGTESKQERHPQIPKRLQTQKNVDRIFKSHWALNFGFPPKLTRNRCHTVLEEIKCSDTRVLSWGHRMCLQPFHRPFPNTKSVPPHSTGLKGVPDLTVNYKSIPHTHNWVTSGLQAKAPWDPSPGNPLRQLIFTWQRAF